MSSCARALILGGLLLVGCKPSSPAADAGRSDADVADDSAIRRDSGRWSPRAAAGFTEANSVWIDVDNGGGWSTYTLELAAQPGWTGEIERLRVDPIISGDGHSVGIDSVVLAP